MIDDEIEGAPKQNPGLSGTGTGGNKKGAIDTEDGISLGIIGSEINLLPEMG